MKKIFIQLIYLIAMVCCCQFSFAQCPNGGSSNIDVDLDGYCNDVDCNDNNNAIHPGAIELCNGIDDNCDGITDSSFIAGLQLYLPFTGNPNDLSGKGHNGTLYNSTLTTDRFSASNNAYFFNGSNAEIRINDAPDLHPANFTLAAWINVDPSVNSNIAIINKSVGSGFYNSWIININYSSNQLVFFYGGDGYYDQNAVTAPSKGVWHLIAATFDDVNNTTKIYIDGTVAGTFSTSLSIGYDNKEIQIGAEFNPAPQAFMKGKIDDPMLFDRTLSAVEINSLYTRGGYTSPLEICNGIDDDCDGLIDEGLTTTYYADADGDGYGNNAAPQVACTQPIGYVTDNTDCNDGNAAINPRATDSYDGIDNDCDGIVDQNSIVRFQYFFDTEPGVGVVGNGAFINVSPTSDSSNITASISTSGLAEGFHTLYVRAQSVRGSWGLWRSYPFTITPPPTVTNHTVTNAEYYFDTETGVASAVQLPIGVSPSDSVNFISSIPSTGLSVGFHTLYLRVKDSQNHWGLWRSYPFAVTPPPPPVSQIVDGEAFFDTDPGVGNGIPLWLPTAPLDSVNISRNVFAPNSLTDGTHHAYFRWRDSNGKWGLYDRASFTVSGSACILPASITANGPITICTGGQVILTENSMGAFTWQWKESGNNVGTNSRHLTVTTAGTYTCEVTSGSCTATSNTIVVAIYPPQTWYEDFDTDGFGNPSVTQIACLQPTGYVSNNTDCNDNNILIHTAIQYFVDADHDGYGSTTTAMVCALTPPLGYSTNDDDCDDTKSFVYPGALELCNGIDDNCNGLIDENQFTISSTITSIKCKGSNTGAIDISINGGLPPITYLWNNGSTNQDRENLFSGTYTVTVTSGGCTSSASYVITQPATVLSISLSKTTIRCGGKSTGILTALPSGGGVSYIYLWTGGFTTATISGIAVGTYTVTITDNLGCTKTKSIQMTENTPQAVYISPAGPANQYLANRSGGVGPWAYHWNTSPLQTTQIATILSSGNYRVKVTDSKGCTVISSVYGVAKTGGSTFEEYSVDNITVHPNPSNGFITINSFDCNNCNINLSLTDILGRLIYKSSEIVAGNQLEKDFSYLQKGIYMLMIKSGNKTKAIKVMMQ